MDGIKLKAGEKFDALHIAAKTAAGNGKSKVEDVYQHTLETIERIREVFNSLWQHELVVESRRRISEFSSDAVRRIKEGAPPLSPMHLYEELRALFRDRVWRRSILLFACGVACGAICGAAAGVKFASMSPGGPRARALHTHPDQSVMLVEDAVTRGASAGEVLVRVQAFSVSPLDRAVLRGHSATLRGLLYTTAVTVGRGFTGVVLDVGPGVTELELGDEVWGCISEWSGGAATDLLIIRSTRLSKRPRGLAADAAASLPWPGTDMLRALDRLRYTADNCKNKRVAVCGAASAEGCLLVQALASWGVHLSVSAPRHAGMALQDLGAEELIEGAGFSPSTPPSSWYEVEHAASTRGPFDALILCAGAHCPATPLRNLPAVLRATAPRDAVVDLRPKAFITDRLPAPFSMIFVVSFYSYRVLRWLVGFGGHTDWLENKYHLTDGLNNLAQMVDNNHIAPVLDKVFLPQDFESALAHACSEDALGTTVIRFP